MLSLILLRCPSGYRRVRRDGWTAFVDGARWRDEWWPIVMAAAEGSGQATLVARSRHATTRRCQLPHSPGTLDTFIKLYSAPRLLKRMKDVVRPSKALRTLLVSTAMAADGLRVPRVLLAGEQRRGPLLGRAALVTEAVAHPSLRQVAFDGLGPPSLRERNAFLAALGREVARLHDRGYIHGDMLATNLLVALGPQPQIWFIDNDRTTRFTAVPRAIAQRRNLVQLNRLILPGVTHTQRLRVFRSYAEARGWDHRRTRSTARFVARKTVERRALMARRASAPPP